MRRSLMWIFCLLPASAYANVVWPALYLETRLFSWWAIGFGLLVEYFFIRWMFKLSANKTVFAALAANAVSVLAGVILIPLAGLAWELFPAPIINLLFNWGTFNPVTWTATFLLGCLVNGLVEGVVYKRWFYPEFRFRNRVFLGLLAANSLSVGAALVSLWLKPVQL